MNVLAEKVSDRYMLVNVAAQRARDIADSAKEHGIVLDRKPVSRAISEIAEDKLTVVEH